LQGDKRGSPKQDPACSLAYARLRAQLRLEQRLLRSKDGNGKCHENIPMWDHLYHNSGMDSLAAFSFNAMIFLNNKHKVVASVSKVKHNCQRNIQNMQYVIVLDGPGLFLGSSFQYLNVSRTIQPSSPSLPLKPRQKIILKTLSDLEIIFQTASHGTKPPIHLLLQIPHNVSKGRHLILFK